MATGSQPILSSTPLQVLLYLNCWYFAAFFLATILMFIYKGRLTTNFQLQCASRSFLKIFCFFPAGLLLPYPASNLILDVALLFLFLGLEILRIFYGWKGNLCEHAVTTAVSLFLLLPCITLSAYFLFLQSLVLRLEFLLGLVLLGFYSLQFLLSILALSAFARSKVY
ncbi:transmembrane protein 216 isoform X2 [Hippocampus zosterae]|uniref:transmembrane protein 216 isoform X2 n=1 Tax=Hippocampus zosterae TaxID=109293 RepID=UPI00223D277B|nr:transmembrane protein 216 isoform X2 [Hippocampus zosterae]